MVRMQPDAATDTPAADNTTTDETPAADNTGAAETPAAEDPATADTTLPEEVQTQEQTEENKEVDPQEGENPVEATGIEVLDADGQEIFNTDGKRFENLQDAINAVPDYEESAENKPIIKISQSIVLTDTITINGKKVSRKNHRPRQRNLFPKRNGRNGTDHKETLRDTYRNPDGTYRSSGRMDQSYRISYYVFNSRQDKVQDVFLYLVFLSVFLYNKK